MTIRIAMWSGPRNISTAMMRSWENRPDCAVVDEPFYACYLQETGVDHPMREDVLASQSSDWQKVADRLVGGPCDQPLQYQKHMTHHMVDGSDLEWVRSLRHCFLIRDPYEVVASYVQKRDSVSTADIGVVRQLELYEQVCELTGQVVPVIDARSILENPRDALQRLCESLDVPFMEDMLSWPAGPRDSDGVWASHWYQAVEESTEFAPYVMKQAELSPGQKAVAAESMDAYRALSTFTLVPNGA